MKILLDGFLQRHRPPKILVVHLDEFSFETNRVLELPYYLPQLPDEHLEQTLCELEPEVVWIASFPPSRVFYYDDLQKWIGVKSFLSLGDSVRTVQHGFSNTSDGGWNDYWELEYQKKLPLVQSPFDSLFAFRKGADLLMKLVQVANQNGISVLLTSSPVPGGENYPKYDAAVSLALQTVKAIDTNVVFYWSHRDTLPRKEYFYDLVHMVRKGAKQYSMAIGDTICSSFPNLCRLENKNPGLEAGIPSKR
jgi:hypothetical protein